MREFSNLANVILARTYARQKPNFRLETWPDVVERVIKGNVSNFNVSEQEINRLRYFMTERKAGPAGRGLWMSGSPTHAKIGGAGLVNCWAYTLDDWMNFVYAMDLLMLGGGVGFSVESRYVYKLPRVKKDVTITHKLSKDADWIVPDSREGWVETLRRVLESWFITGKSFTYSTICVRGPGEAISGFGGISSGPRPLIKAIEKICAVFCSRQGKQLHPIHAVDIAAAIGELVVSGNIRRCLPKGALVHAKDGLIPIEKVSRGQEVLTTQGYRKVLNTFEQGEQELIRIKTQDGIFDCTPNHKMAVMTSPTSFVWKMAKDIQKDDRLAAGRNPIEGKKTFLPKWEYKKPKNSTTCIDIKVPELDADMAWFIGLFHADGYTFANRGDDGFNAHVNVVLGLHERDIALKAKKQLERWGVKPKMEKRKNENSIMVHVQSKQLAWYFDQHFKKPSVPIQIPDFILQGSLDVRKAYAAGVADGDGALGNKPILVVSTVYPEFARQLQSLLYSCGIETRMKSQGKEWKSRIGWQFTHTVSLINRTAIERFSAIPHLNKPVRKKLTGQYTNTYPSKWFTTRKAEFHAVSNDVSVNHYDLLMGAEHLVPVRVLSVEPLTERRETYDIEVDGQHEFFCNGYLTHNSALIFLGDAGDKEYLKAKRFDLGPVPTQRAMANFSVVADNAEDELGKLFWDTYRHGEPFGIVNRKNIRKYGRMGEEKEDTALIVNPCFPSWASVLTPIGIKTIGDVNIGDTIWSGSCWTKVINKESRGVKQVNGYVTSAGTFYGTENHKVLSHGQKIEAGQAKSIDTCVGPATNLKISQLDPQDIMNGLVFGDGFLHKATQKEMLIIGKNDGDYHNSEISNLIIANSSTTHWYVKTTYTPQERVWARNVPDGYYKGDFNQICGFLRGVYSANGSVVRNRITLKSTCLPAVGRIQSMLSALGISSYYTVNKKHNVKFDNGDYECKESYDLNIGTLEGRKIFAQAVGFIQKYKAEKLNKSILEQKRIKGGGKKTYEVKGTLVLNQEEVFDITVEHESHALWNGNLHVGNCGEATLPSGSCCNLQNINLAAINNIEEFKEAARLFHRYGKRVACEKYHIEYSNKIIHEENRVGTSITGCLQNPLLFNPNVLDTVYAEIQKENIKYSKELGIEPSIRTTTVNPGGTVSKLYDAVCEGIHPAYSRHIIQRVRIASNDPLIPKLRAAGHYMEPVERFDGTLDSDTYVVDFYVKAPDNAPCADEGFDTWKQLEALQVAQKHWADQSCSVTVYYNEEELGKVKEWVTDNLDSIKTISFLKHSGHKFKQAPKEPITKEQYEKLSSKIKPIETEDVGLGEVEGLGCEGGACPIR